MPDEIKVYVAAFGDRAHYQMQYRDPTTGKLKTRSTGIERTGRKREQEAAQREAAKWEAELQEGRYHAPNRVTWEGFRERYEAEVLPSLAAKTREKAAAVFGAIERTVAPRLLRDLTASRISALQARMRDDGRTEATIAGNLAHLRAALAWAVRMGLLPKVPDIPRPKRAKAQKMMKGRPISGEEFDRMLDKVAAGLLAIRETPKPTTPPKRIIGPEARRRYQDAARVTVAAQVPAWRSLLEGLWTSGLRLGEALELLWESDGGLSVDLTGRHPMLRIPAAMEKGNQDRMLPMAPEFAEFLMRTPEAERTGRVFKLAMTRNRASRVVSAIGKAAGVKVNTDAAGKAKFASAHDLRRSFGERWATRVMPQVLMELMRHESIETTMRYYVGRNAQRTADALWAAHKTAAPNTAPNSRPQVNSRTVDLDAATADSADL